MRDIMKRFLVIIIFATLFCAGCSRKTENEVSQSDHGKSDTSSPGEPLAHAPQGPTWSLKLNSECLSGPTEECVAGYGFTVTADGKYAVGPGPQDQQLTGRVTEDQFKSLEKLVSGEVSGSAAERCQVLGTNTTRDAISLRTQRDEVQLIRTSGTEFCFSASSFERARDLHALLLQLASSYYPLPFPDDSCDGSMTSLEALYGMVQKCDNDVDCAYFDDDFQPIGRDVFTFVVARDCSGVTPLMVGNVKLTDAQRPTLLAVADHAKSACKRRASNCPGFAGFQSTQPAPVCLAHTCRPGTGTL